MFGEWHLQLPIISEICGVQFPICQCPMNFVIFSYQCLDGLFCTKELCHLPFPTCQGLVQISSGSLNLQIQQITSHKIRMRKQCAMYPHHTQSHTVYHCKSCAIDLHVDKKNFISFFGLLYSTHLKSPQASPIPKALIRDLNFLLPNPLSSSVIWTYIFS